MSDMEELRGEGWPTVTMTLAGCLKDRAEMAVALVDAKIKLKELQSSGLLPVAAMGAVSDIIRSLNLEGRNINGKACEQEVSEQRKN